MELRDMFSFSVRLLYKVCANEGRSVMVKLFAS
jgi:hypothetical protein